MDFLGSCKVTLALRVSQPEMFIRQLKSKNDISSFMIQGQVYSLYFLLLRSIFIFYYFFFKMCIHILPKYKFLNESVSFQYGGPLGGLSLKIIIMSMSSIFMDAKDSNLNSGMDHCDQVVESQGQGLEWLISLGHFPQTRGVVGKTGTQALQRLSRREVLTSCSFASSHTCYLIWF